MRAHLPAGVTSALTAVPTSSPLTAPSIASTLRSNHVVQFHVHLLLGDAELRRFDRDLGSSAGCGAGDDVGLLMLFLDCLELGKNQEEQWWKFLDSGF